MMPPSDQILVGNRWLTKAERHALWYEQEASNHIPACPRYPVAKLVHLLPAKYLTKLAEEAKYDCCKNALEHDIEAFYSSAADQERGRPDVYVLHCNCGRPHRRFCVGGGDDRPVWEVR